MNRGFVRIGKWFVKPYQKEEKTINKRYVLLLSRKIVGYSVNCKIKDDTSLVILCTLNWGSIQSFVLIQEHIHLIVCYL